MNLTMLSGELPTPVGSLVRPVAEMRYRSSLPMDMPMTRFVKSLPYFEIAPVRAVSSLSMLVTPEVHMPRRILVLVSMAASKAEMGSDSL